MISIDHKDGERTLGLGDGKWCFAYEAEIVDRAEPDTRLAVRYDVALTKVLVVCNTTPSPGALAMPIERKHVELTVGQRTFGLDHVVNPHITVESAMLAERDSASDWTVLWQSARNQPPRRATSHEQPHLSRSPVQRLWVAEHQRLRLPRVRARRLRHRAA